VLGVIGAVIAALATWAVAVAILGVDLLARPGSGSAHSVGATAVVSSSLIASLLGWALLALLEHRTSSARAIWTGVALVVLLLSLGGPLTAGVTAGDKAALAVLHLAVGAVLISTMRRSSPSTEPAARRATEARGRP